MPLRPASRVAAALAVLALTGGALAWWFVWRAPPPEWPDTVSEAALVRALSAEDLPLSAEHTDVVVAAVCTFRRDRLEPYGHPLPTSPFLDRLAEHGVLFETNFAQTTWTRPSMGALVTGRWPRVLKLDNPTDGSSFGLVLGEEHTTLAEALQARGYRTVGAVANPNVMARFGFAQGFDAYMEPEGSFEKAHQAWRGDRLVDRVLDEARATPAGQRFYARLLLTDTHVPRKYAGRYYRLLAGWLLPDGATRRTAYDASARQVDAWLARLFVELREERPNLLFVVVADHGEGLRLPEHHGPGHGNHLYRSTVQTPVIWSHPSLPDPGRRVGGLSMNIDVVPTVLDLLGIAADQPLDGRSEAQAVLGLRADAVHDAVFAETFFRRARRSTVFDGRYQLIRNDKRLDAGRPGERLYAAADVDATDDLAQARPDDMRELTARLDAWQAEMDRLALTTGDGVEGTLDDETRKMLEEMGYVDD